MNITDSLQKSKMDKYTDPADSMKNVRVKDKFYMQRTTDSTIKTNENVTADDQSNSDLDINITRQIRSAVIRDKNLSLKAHNIKIITIKGIVTLRGRVDTETEKQSIANIAANIAGDGKIINELDVK